MRTSVLTLVIVNLDPSDADEMLAIVRQLGERHPSRAVVIELGDRER